MSVSGRKRVSKWDSKEEDLSGNDYSEQQHERFYPEGKGRNGSSKRSAPDVVDDEHLKSRQQQHPGEAWPPRSSRGGDAAAMMGYYDSRKSSSEQDESWDRPRTRRSGSRSNSRSRSRSPVQRVRRDAGGGGSYDSRHKTRSGREVDGRYNRAGGDHDWEPKNRKTRDTSYYKEEDSREQYPLRVGGRSEDNNNNSRRETQRRDVSEREYNRISNVPCRYFALGNCRNGTSCRFSHHGARTSPGRKPQDEMFGRHDNNHRWNERSDTGKSSEGAKGSNNGNWIDDMEMSPDWNYGVKTLKKPLNGGKDSLAPSYEHGSAEEVMSQQVGDRRSIGMFPSGGEKTVASSHHGFSNNSAPPIQAFSQIQSALPYQNTPVAVGGSQVLPPPPAAAAATHLPENGNAVSREELNHISNISASLAQLFGNGQPITNFHSTLNPIQSMQMPQVYGQKEQSSHSQTDILGNNSIHTGVVPAVTTLQINNSDSLVSLAENPKPSSEENRDKRREEEAGKEPDGRKTEETDAEKVVEEEEDDEDDGAGDENKKKEKDPKGMRAFKFSLVEIVKELLKPAWKEGGMNKDAYKNIVKKVVDKVTGAIQTGNIPQTQEKIDHYLSASKPKLTKLVQAYISKVKKS